MISLRPVAVLLGLAAPDPIQLPDIVDLRPDDPVRQNVDQSIIWFDQNARRSMHAHFTLRTLQIILAAAIPVTQVLWTGLGARASAAILGALVAVVQGIDILHHYGQHYIAWRNTAQQLRRERYLFSIHAASYANPPQGYDARRLLAEHVDSITAAESHQWLAFQESGQTTEHG
jgi:hypothetical protein